MNCLFHFPQHWGREGSGLAQISLAGQELTGWLFGLVAVFDFWKRELVAFWEEYASKICRIGRIARFEA